MSVSDPLIKDLKACVQHFLKPANEKIADNTTYFIHLAQILEKIFYKGLILVQHTKFFGKLIDPYAWMVAIVKNANLTFENCLENVKNRKDISTNSGKFRLLIKFCLVKKCLHVPVEFLINSPNCNMIYMPCSVLGDEILAQIFLSVLLQLSKFSFDLDLRHSSFLDFGWPVPSYVHLELVPCKNLGIAVSFSENKAVVVNVKSDGVAAENGNIKMGDILDKLNGVHIDSSCKGRLGCIVRRRGNNPVEVTVVKGYNKEEGDFFTPVFRMMKQLKIDCDMVKKQYAEGNEDLLPKKISYGYQVRYLGTVDVGKFGNVKQVQKGIRRLRENCFSDSLTAEILNMEANFEIGEIGLKVTNKEASEIILDQSFMKISACGNVSTCANVFGYCVGDKNCDIATNFICHIFEAKNFHEADMILHSIGQGFTRTHFAV